MLSPKKMGTNRNSNNSFNQISEPLVVEYIRIIPRIPMCLPVPTMLQGTGAGVHAFAQKAVHLYTIHLM